MPNRKNEVLADTQAWLPLPSVGNYQRLAEIDGSFLVVPIIFRSENLFKEAEKRESSKGREPRFRNPGSFPGVGGTRQLQVILTAGLFLADFLGCFFRGLSLFFLFLFRLFLVVHGVGEDELEIVHAQVGGEAFVA